ncbi:MAG: ribosome recycling factor [Caldiserica bacterium]|nr:ribosome recycling factor [Caldisericota bacterium]MDH7562886.1 ribosome recycling factor [Caldisericota bacterium]
MNKALSFLQEEFKTIRAGKVTPAVLEKITVNYFGSLLPINQLATISTPEPRVLVIQPWDQSILKEIEKAILKANLGVTPQVDRGIIRLVFPPLTEERRKEFVKAAKKMAEDCRVELRNHRREANESIKELKDQGKISEDDRDRYLEKVQKLLDKYIELVDLALEKKESSIMEV